MYILRSLALAILVSLTTHSVRAEEPTDGFFETFVRTIVMQDYSRLQEYVSPREKFFSNGRLTPDTEAFLYDGPRMRIRNPHARSIVEIVQLGVHEIKIVQQGDSRVTFYWIPKRNLRDASEADFFEKEWMKKYFACEFSLVGSTYKLALNFCFAETDGPHSSPYG